MLLKYYFLIYQERLSFLIAQALPKSIQKSVVTIIASKALPFSPQKLYGKVTVEDMVYFLESER